VYEASYVNYTRELFFARRAMPGIASELSSELTRRHNTILYGHWH